MWYLRQLLSPAVAFHRFLMERRRAVLYPGKLLVWSQPLISFDGQTMLVGCWIFRLGAFELIFCIAVVAGDWVYIDGGEFSYTSDGTITYQYSTLSSRGPLTRNHPLIILASLHNPFHRSFANMVELHCHHSFDIQTKRSSRPSEPVVVVRRAERYLILWLCRQGIQLR